MKKGLKICIMCCLCIVIGVVLSSKFNLMEFINNISEYKIVIEKNDGEQNKESQADNRTAENINTDESTEKTSKVDNSKKERIEKKQSKKNVKSNKSVKDNVKKAKQSVIKQCGDEFRDVIYTGKTEFKGGKYYCFGINIDGDVGGDMTLLVDTTTFKAYESSVDGYFGPYRGANSNVFTYDMAVEKLENELGWHEDRIYSLIEERSNGFIIKTSFYAPGGTGTGETYYVTKDIIDVATNH